MFPRISLAFFYQLQFLFYFCTESFSSAFCKCSCDLNVGSISSNFALRYCFYHEKSDANNFDDVCMASFLFVISKYELNMTRIFSIKESTSMCIGVGERELIFFLVIQKRTHVSSKCFLIYLPWVLLFRRETFFCHYTCLFDFILFLCVSCFLCVPCRCFFTFFSYYLRWTHKMLIEQRRYIQVWGFLFFTIYPNPHFLFKHFCMPNNDLSKYQKYLCILVCVRWQPNISHIKVDTKDHTNRLCVCIEASP